MEKLGVVAWAAVLFAMVVGFIANPWVLVAMIALYGAIYKVGTWLTRSRDEKAGQRRGKWVGL